MAHADAWDPDINHLNFSLHIAGAIDFEKPRLLLPRQVSRTFASSDAIIPYLREVGSTHTFYLPWGECTITLQDVAYHLELRTGGKLVGGCLHDFQTWYQRPTWKYMEELLSARRPHGLQQGAQRKNSFSIKMTWL
ncbi:hypothetical protein Ahy_B09g098247 [Arachis hypogaea]|uniref:Aminotransferase-like plant mobile domain-containing protein n=1 Tax=Arachis hypogaea TaxID=3818 RepID=A0A444XQX8_ARAHY|nr:hypothetical protein Ahy_B09g098247 [Arachis hypogaea]